MHSQWKSAQRRFQGCSHLLAWNVIVGSALHQFKCQLKELIHEVQKTLQDFADRQITTTTTSEKDAVQDALKTKKYCQELYFKLRPKKWGIWGFKC